MNSSIRKEIDIIYSNKQKSALRRKESRVNEVYEACPSLRDVDLLIKAAYIALSYNHSGLRAGEKLLATFSPAGREYFSMTLQALTAETEKLKQKRASLLQEAGFDEKYLEDVYECNLCKDTGYIKEDVIQKRCPCHRKLVVSMLKKQSVMFNENHTFETFRSDYYSQEVDEARFGISVSPRAHMEKVLGKVKSFVENFDNPDADNMIFSGRTGTGKTFMANCVMASLLDSGKEVLFMPAGSLFKPFAVYDNDEKEDMRDLKDMIYGCDLLIIDDLGSEKMTSARYSEFIDILNTRAQAGRKNIITTNLTPKNIRDTYDERISSRLLGTYDIYRFTGDDIRLKTK